jgi:cytochrome b561
LILYLLLLAVLLVGIAWEILAGAQISSKFYSIATDWKATDWLIANFFAGANPK